MAANARFFQQEPPVTPAVFAAGVPNSVVGQFESRARISPGVDNHFAVSHGFEAPGIAGFAVSPWPNFGIADDPSRAAGLNYEFIINTLGSMIALKGAIGVERPIGPILPSPFKTGDLILRIERPSARSTARVSSVKATFFTRVRPA
jgi:hypothetical protein